MICANFGTIQYSSLLVGAGLQRQVKYSVRKAPKINENLLFYSEFPTLVRVDENLNRKHIIIDKFHSENSHILASPIFLVILCESRRIFTICMLLLSCLR